MDDEINIKSMHKLIFSKYNIKLNCCSTEQEMISLIDQIEDNNSNSIFISKALHLLVVNLDCNSPALTSYL